MYELYRAFPNASGSWDADSGAVYTLTLNSPLRPAGWTSADAAGLPILPGLVRYDEVAAGEINHAIRFTVPQTRRAYVWPARHFASSLTGLQYPPTGQRFRLKASVVIDNRFSPHAQVILRAMKTYGMILADNGSAWYISGAPDERSERCALGLRDRSRRLDELSTPDGGAWLLDWPGNRHGEFAVAEYDDRFEWIDRGGCYAGARIDHTTQVRISCLTDSPAA